MGSVWVLLVWSSSLSCVVIKLWGLRSWPNLLGKWWHWKVLYILVYNVISWDSIDTFMQHDIQELSRVVRISLPHSLPPSLPPSLSSSSSLSSSFSLSLPPSLSSSSSLSSSFSLSLPPLLSLSPSLPLPPSLPLSLSLSPSLTLPLSLSSLFPLFVIFKILSHHYL